MVSSQLPLPFNSLLPPDFSNFARGDNGLALDMVSGLLAIEGTAQLYLWGGDQSGKSHLLLAAHRQWMTHGYRSFYASLADESLTASLLDSLEGYDFVAIDDVSIVAGRNDWELALFNLINFSREKGAKLLFSASVAPSPHNWVLADLASRLAWGPVMKLQALKEEDIRITICDAAERCGMQLESGAVDFLLKRYRRDVSSLLLAISTLDSESLAAGRARITIPFMKRCLVFD